MSIYVERLIRASMDSVWTHTQDPSLHQLWDLRFTRIEYLPRPDPEQPQHFRYTTRLGFGLSVSGEGESLGRRELPDGSRTSVLKFSSPQARSLIREGRGYWKYTPTPEGVRFVTSYEYDTRFGLIGRIVDRIAFRPLIGWATAWSFDRLRLWLEDGVRPGRSMRQALVHGVSRIGLAFVFAYHGLVPKLLVRNPDEVAILQALGIPAAGIGAVLVAFGIAEVLLAASMLAFWHRAWPAVFGFAFAVVSTVTVSLAAPFYLVAAFNPLTLNVLVGCLATVDLLSLDGLPSAGRCRRQARAEVP